MAESDSDGFNVVTDGYSPVATSSVSSAHVLYPRPKALPRVVPGVNNAFFENLALRMNRGTRHGTLPWERGYAAAVLGTSFAPRWPNTDPPLKSLVLATNRAESILAPTPVRTIPTSVSVTAYRRVKFVKHAVSPDALRQRALVKWRMFIESDLESTVVGQQMLAAVESLAPDSEILELLANVFDPKKTATLVKRISSLLEYLVWCRSKAVFRPLLFDEQTAYAYVRSLMQANAAATKASSFSQALAFFRHTLGCPSADAAIKSARFKGCCSRQYKKKRKLKQAVELRVNQLRIFESLTSRAPAEPDRCAAGFFMFCSMASSRCHDTMSAETCLVESEDDGSCTALLGTSNSKTATTQQLQTQLLPLLAFAPGLLRDENWIDSWMKAREHCGLKFGPGLPVLPALGSDGKFLDRAASSAELIAWMRELLRMGGEYSSEVSTHSCKRTILIWAAKYGCPLEDRRLLGHHAHPSMKSILTYSKEALAGPMALIWSMFSEILQGTFDPESTAIRRITKRPCTTTIAAGPSLPIPPKVVSADFCQADFEVDEEWDGLGMEFEEGQAGSSAIHQPQVEEISDSSSEDTSSSSDTDLSEQDVPDIEFDDEILEAAGLEAAPNFSHYANFETFQHRVSGTLHYRNAATPTKFLCSRILSASYTRVLKQLKFEWPKCHQCVGKAEQIGN